MIVPYKSKEFIKQKDNRIFVESNRILIVYIYINGSVLFKYYEYNE